MLEWLKEQLLKDTARLVAAQLEGKQNKEITPLSAVWFVLVMVNLLALVILPGWPGVLIVTLIVLIGLFAVYVVFLGIGIARYAGMVEGARAALENPPAIGEAQIELTYQGEQIWVSEKIDFQPKQEPEGENLFAVAIEQARKKGRRGELKIWQRREKVAELLEDGWTQEQIAEELEYSPRTIARDVQELKKMSK